MYEVIEVYATFESGQDLYKDIYTSFEEAQETQLMVVPGWVIIDTHGYVAEDTNDIYFDYSEAINDLVGLESKEEEE